MQATIIKGTYHRHGVVTELVDCFVAGLKQEHPDAVVSIIELLDARVEFCCGCGECGNTDAAKPLGDCSITADDTRDILEQMLASDVVVFATPIYLLGPTAIMKRFMERMIVVTKPSGVGTSARTPKRRHKIGVVLLSSGAPYPINVLAGMTRYPSRILGMLCGMVGCGRVFRLKAGGIETSQRLRNGYRRKATQLGRRVALSARP